MEGSNGKKNQKKAETPVRFLELFRFADGLDYVLMGVGTMGALGHGVSLPLFYRVLANLLNSFGGNANNVDKMSSGVAKVNTIYIFLYLIN